jgi:putative nucleotidyltransferase with HDIG domain
MWKTEASALTSPCRHQRLPRELRATQVHESPETSFFLPDRELTTQGSYTPYGGGTTFGEVAREFDRIAVYAALLASAALALAGLFVLIGIETGPLWVVFALGGVAALAERQPVRVNANMEMTVAALPMLFAAIVYGPLAAMLVGVVGLTSIVGAPYVRWIIWTSVRVIAAGVAGAAALWILSLGTSFGTLILAVTVATSAEALLDVGLALLTVRVRGSGSPREFVRSMAPIVCATVPFFTSVLVLVVYAYHQISPWSVLLFVGPAVAAHNLHRLYRQEREAVRELTSANARLARANLSFASALVATLDARDQYTAGHSAAVAHYARDIAARMGLTEAEQETAYLCGLVHDIGKIGLPPGLLEKPGPLTLEERRQMETHTTIGERILANVDDYASIARVVRHHHERYDGNGYPDGLAGDEIPLLSRIIAVADAYDAMTSDRPYREAMASRVARLRLAQAAATQFDTSVIAAFEAILAGASEAYRLGFGARPTEPQHREPRRLTALAR